MTIPAPPVGALVRHTTRYPDGTVITMEGRVVKLPEVEFSEPYICIGAEARVGFLVDREGYTVGLEVLEVPGIEPPNGTTFGNGIDAIIRADDPDEADPEGRWWTTGMEDYQRWAVVRLVVTGPGWRRYRPDPADEAPELPFKLWQSGDRLVIVEPSDAYADRLFVEVDSAHLVHKDVRQLAAALWAWAAREVEKP